jgi:hypothetical protein
LEGSCQSRLKKVVLMIVIWVFRGIFVKDCYIDIRAWQL